MSILKFSILNSGIGLGLKGCYNAYRVKEESLGMRLYCAVLCCLIRIQSRTHQNIVSVFDEKRQRIFLLEKVFFSKQNR